MLPPGDNPQRRAYFASQGSRRIFFPVKGRGGLARRNRRILYGAATAGGVGAALYATTRLPPALTRRVFIANSELTPKIVREGVKVVRRGKRRPLLAIRSQEPSPLGEHYAHYGLSRPESAYVHPRSSLSQRHTFAYRTDVGEAERNFVEGSLTGRIAKRFMSYRRKEGTFVAVPPLAREYVKRRARMRARVANLVERRALNFEPVYRSLGRLEEASVDRARKAVRGAVGMFTDRRPPKEAVRLARRQIVRSDKQGLRDVRLRMEREVGTLPLESVLAMAKNEPALLTAPSAESFNRRAAAILTRKHLREQSRILAARDYPSLAERTAERVIGPTERRVRRLNDRARARLVDFLLRHRFPVEQG